MKQNLKISYSTHVCLACLAELDRHPTCKPVMVSCEFDSHWRQLYFLRHINANFVQKYVPNRNYKNSHGEEGPRNQYIAVGLKLKHMDKNTGTSTTFNSLPASPANSQTTIEWEQLISAEELS